MNERPLPRFEDVFVKLFRLEHFALIYHAPESTFNHSYKKGYKRDIQNAVILTQLLGISNQISSTHGVKGSTSTELLLRFNENYCGAN